MMAWRFGLFGLASGSRHTGLHLQAASGASMILATARFGVLNLRPLLVFVSFIHDKSAIQASKNHNPSDGPLDQVSTVRMTG